MTRHLLALLLTFVVLTILLSAPAPGAKHETWFEVRSPNFIVVSNAGEKQARKSAARFEQIRAVFRRSLTVANAHVSPTITIFAVKDEDSVKALLPEYWDKGRAHPAGIFFEQMNQYFALVQLDASGSNPYSPIYHEYYHSLTLPYYPNLPLWVAEGLADFYGNTELSDSEVRMGRVDLDLIGELRQGNFIPLEVLFNVDHSSPYYNEQNKTSIFYAESWALTHYLMVGDNASHKPMLIAYLNELSHGATQEQAAARSFGNVKKLQDALYSYIESRSFYYLKSAPPPEIAASDLQVRELSDAEVDAYRGGFAAARGRTQQAIPILEQAVKLDPKLALGYQYLGFAEFLNGQRSEALADFTRAIDLNPKNALTRFLRAYLTSQQAGAIGSDAQMEGDLREAITVSPEFAPPYGVLVVYLLVQGQNLPEALALAQKAVALEPGNAGYQMDLAQVLARMNRYEEARTFALHAHAGSTDPEQRQQAEQFLEFLKQQLNIPAGNPETSTAGAKPQEPVASSTPASARALHPAPEGSAANAAGDLREATGVVTKVSCMGGLKFEMTTATGGLTLHIGTGAHVQIRMMNPPAGPFNPCTALQGQRVSAQYQPQGSDGKSGTMEMLTVLSGASGEANASTKVDSVGRLDVGAGHKERMTSAVEGNVRQVSCTGNELVLTLDAGEGLFTLHARDATRVPYEKDVAFDTGEFQACSQLQGRLAKITFVVVDNQKYDGEIQGVEILK
jgi:tetratricopeptide (TPR) repeat protein